MPEFKKTRPQFRNIGLLKDLPAYIRVAPASLFVSILHRISGVILFVLLPVLLWLLDATLRSQESFANIFGIFDSGRWGIPGWFFRLVLLLPIWSFFHHFLAGLRHVLMDINHAFASKEASTTSARAMLVVSIFLTILVALKMFV